MIDGAAVVANEVGESAVRRHDFRRHIKKLLDVRSEMRAVHQAPRNFDAVNYAPQVLGVFKVVQVNIDRHGRIGTSQTDAPTRSRTLQSWRDSDTRPGHVEAWTRPQILIVEIENIHLHVIELG